MNCQHCRAENAPDARFCGSCGRATSATEPSRAGDLRGVMAAPDLTGREIAGRYRVLTKLGEGGMGAVYRGEQMSLKRKIAIKLLRPELSADPGLVRRFNAEAELVAKLSHPNTVNIYDFGQDADGTLFIAMEYLEGRSLRQLIAGEGPVPAVRALHIAAQIAASLTDAHSHGIVHRDLKPDNVMLTERGRHKDVVRVLDFGIAKLRDEQNQVTAANPMTRAGDLVGTPQYMAPEQIRGDQVDGRTDVYALGAIIYEMVTGRLVFEGTSLMAILSRHLIDAPEPPSRRRPELGIPPGIDALVAAMLAKDPAQRVASMDAATERITALTLELGGSAVTPASWGGTGGQGAVGTPAPGAIPTAPPKRPSQQMRPPGVPQTLPPGMMMAPPDGRAPQVALTQPVRPPVQPQPQPQPQPQLPYPPPQPVMMVAPPPAAYPPRPRAAPTSHRWLWLLVGVIVLAGVIGVIAISLTRPPAGSASDDDGTGTAVARRDLPPPPRADTLAGELTSVGSFQVNMPLGFIEAPGQTMPEGKVYTGTIDGNLTMIMLFAAGEETAGSSKAELDQGCSDIATQYFGGQMTASATVTSKGSQFYRCTLTGNGQTIEGALYGGPGDTLAVFFASDPYAFDALAGARAELFDQRVLGASAGASP